MVTKNKIRLGLILGIFVISFFISKPIFAVAVPCLDDGTGVVACATFVTQSDCASQVGCWWRGPLPGACSGVTITGRLACKYYKQYDVCANQKGCYWDYTNFAVPNENSLNVFYCLLAMGGVVILIISIIMILGLRK